MGYYADSEIFEKAIDITIAAVGCSCDSNRPVTRPQETAEFIQVVYDKLKEIGGTIKD